jgi:hypothetical protein
MVQWVLSLASAPFGIGPVLGFVGGHCLTAINIGLRALTCPSFIWRCANGSHSHDHREITFLTLPCLYNSQFSFPFPFLFFAGKNMNEQPMNRLSECKMTAFSVVAVAPHGLSLLYHFLKCVSFQILFTFF